MITSLKRAPMTREKQDKGIVGLHRVNHSLEGLFDAA